MNRWGALVSLVLAALAGLVGYEAGRQRQRSADRVGLEEQRQRIRDMVVEVSGKADELEVRTNKSEEDHIRLDDGLRFPRVDPPVRKASR